MSFSALLVGLKKSGSDVVIKVFRRRDNVRSLARRLPALSVCMAQGRKRPSVLFQFELIDLVWISIIMPSLRSLLRRQLRKIPGVVPLWRLIKKMPRYRILRLVGHATFPIFGRQMPLRGYYARMSDYLKGDNGYSIDLGSRLSTDRSAPSHFAALNHSSLSSPAEGRFTTAASSSHPITDSWPTFRETASRRRKPILPCTRSCCLRFDVSPGR